MSERLHVVPVDDLKPHSRDGEYCACQPEVRTVESGNRLVIHNAYDGREFYEQEDEESDGH